MFIAVLAVWAIFVLLVEAAMWFLFHRGIIRISIPTNTMAHRGPHISMAMFHIFALLHTTLLLSVITAAHIFLW